MEDQPVNPLNLYCDMLVAADLAERFRRGPYGISRYEEHRLLDAVSRIADATGQTGRRVWLHLVEKNFNPQAS